MPSFSFLGGSKQQQQKNIQEADDYKHPPTTDYPIGQSELRTDSDFFHFEVHVSAIPRDTISARLWDLTSSLFQDAMQDVDIVGQWTELVRRDCD